MDIGIQKTVVFICFIFIGVLLKVKFKSKDEVQGLKKIILNLALPATIFIALLGVNIEAKMLLLPLAALGLNFLLFWIMPFLLPVLGIAKDTREYRTAKLLIPSLAPGLSCFPFISEFLGDSYLAKAAMADLGNKVFVLIFLYLVAMKWFYLKSTKKSVPNTNKVINLLKVMLYEPVNLFIIAALVLLGLGFTLDSFPFFISETLNKMSLIMTPLVLLFIGLAVKIRRKQLAQILSLLCFRAGVVFFIIGVFIAISGLMLQNEILLFLAFGLSACSFWPYAHMAVVGNLEIEEHQKEKTFKGSFAIAILAISFPFSTLLILGVLNSGSTFTSNTNLFLTGIVLMVLGGLFPSVTHMSKKVAGLKIETPKIPSGNTERI